MFEVEAKLITWKKANPEKKEEARWAEAGKGPLKIIADPGTKARLVMRTKIGRVILNCTMHVGMKVEKSGKSRIQTSLLGVGDPPVAELTGCLIGVKQENIDDFQAALTKHIPQ